MYADYKRMYICLAAAMDKALTALENNSPELAGRLLQDAALEAEDIYLDTEDTVKDE